MDKNSFFYGHSVFGQLISLIDRNRVKKAVLENQSDRFNKGFDTWCHLVSMLFTALGDCHSLREVSSGFLGLKYKTEHLGIRKIPRRSTLSDANKKRNSKVFQDIYYSLLKQYSKDIPDSRLYKDAGYKTKKMIDSSTISLFLGIFKCVGRPPISGKHKGGVKVHTLLNSQDFLPELVWITDASKNDINFFDKITFEKDVIYLFDKGYVDYWKYRNIERVGAFYVTRLRENAVYSVIEEKSIPQDVQGKVLKDQIIELNLRVKGQTVDHYQVRLVEVWDDLKQETFQFITNITDLEAVNIAALYSDRWDIELLFKQLKQNFPLKYFLGDNRNAIEIQIWCTLIVNLLITVIKKSVKKSWAFSNITSFIRLHIFNYLHLINFLNTPEKDWDDPPGNAQTQILFT